MSRSFGIDLVRAVAILIVMMRHLEFLPGFNYGIYAIEFLFVVSGYLIGQILFNNFYSTETVQLSSVKRFMMRRWFRILPLYYVALLLKFATNPSVGWNVLYYVFFLQNHFYGINFFFETWSLVIDEWFYLGTPVFLYVFMRFISSKKSHIFYYLIGMVVSINIMRIIYAHLTDMSWSALNGNIVLHQDTLLIGVILAYVKHQYFDFFKRLDTKSCFYAGSLLVILHSWLMYTIRYPEDRIDEFFWLKVFDFSVFAVIIAAMMPYIENSVKPLPQRSMKFLNKIVVWGSKLSYALYLTHGMAIGLSIWLLSPFLDNFVVWGILGIFLAILSSYILYQRVEKPFLKIRDRYYPDKV